jgi:hypothetical protein
MTEKAKYDCSPQTGNAHILAHELFAEVLARFPGIEEVPVPLVTEICHRLGRPIIEDGIVCPHKLATLLNARVEDKLIIGERTRQRKKLAKVS